MSSSSGKQYGLLLPKKDKGDAIQRPAIFNEDSDSGGSATGTGDWVKKTYQKEASKSVEKRNTKIHMQKALNQDPTIYQYDEVYDDIKEKNTKTEVKKDEKKTSRYIQSLKKNAERRKLENERRQERIVQKERLAEGEQFKDKETFVTSAYRKKLEEFNKMDEEEKRMDYIEDICDVSKQKDLGGFYRHLYKSTVDDKDETKTDASKSVAEPAPAPSKPDSSSTQPSKSKRHYRKHARSESSLEEGEANDSDSSTSSSSTSGSNSESGEEIKNGKKQSVDNTSKNKKEESSNFDKHKRLKRNDKSEKKPVDKSKTEDNDKDQTTSKPVASNEAEEEVKEPKPKINIWGKRTIGAVFDDALKKFLERSANRHGVF